MRAIDSRRTFTNLIASAHNLTVLEMFLEGFEERSLDSGREGNEAAPINDKDVKCLKPQAMECLENKIRTILLQPANTLQSLGLG